MMRTRVLFFESIVHIAGPKEHFFSVLAWRRKRGMCRDVSSKESHESLFRIHLSIMRPTLGLDEALRYVMRRARRCCPTYCTGTI